MKIAISLLQRLALCAAFASGCLLAQAQDAPPQEAFQAVHLIRVDTTSHPAAEKTILAAIAEMNKAIVKAGCKTCIYHLWKVAGDSTGRLNYLQISYWPGREVYEKVHSSAEYNEASKNWQSLRSVVADEDYFRFVELKP
jgi:hypothetical protein